MPSWQGAASGAAAGAGVGSVVPFLGTGVGAGIGALIGGLRGGKKDAAATPGGAAASAAPTLDSVTKQLQDRAAGKNAQPNAHGDEGAQMLQQFAQYFRDLIGPDPNALLAATAGDRGRVIDQYDTARRSAAEFGPRGSGGGTAASALSRVSQANELVDVTASARQNAATQGSQVAGMLAQLGISEEQLKSMDLGQLLNAILSKEQLKQGDATRRSQMVSGLAEGVGTLLGLYLTRSKAA